MSGSKPDKVLQSTPVELQKLIGASVVEVAVNQLEERSVQQNALFLIAARTRIMDATAQILSPCISVCRMNAASDLCNGCFRTRDEIAVWGNATDDAKLAIWARIEERIAAVQA